MRNAVLRMLAFILICGALSCSRPAGDNASRHVTEQKVRSILAQISDLQDKEASRVREMMQRPPLFAEGNLKAFPGNRSQLEETARQQIKSVEELVELAESQVQKLDEIETLPVDRRFKDYADLLAKKFKKGLESKRLDIESYRLILDSSITTREMLEERNQPLVKRPREIDSEIAALEEKRKSIRPSSDAVGRENSYQ